MMGVRRVATQLFHGFGPEAHRGRCPPITYCARSDRGHGCRDHAHASSGSGRRLADDAGSDRRTPWRQTRSARCGYRLWVCCKPGSACKETWDHSVHAGAGQAGRAGGHVVAGRLRVQWEERSTYMSRKPCPKAVPPSLPASTHPWPGTSSVVRGAMLRLVAGGRAIT